MHQLGTIIDSEWNSLVASKPKEFTTSTTQQFFVEALVLARKWQEKVEKFMEVKNKALEMVPKLGPSFEGDKVETIQDGSGRNLEVEVKDKQQANLDTIEEIKN
jgi:hypothetical protein